MIVTKGQGLYVVKQDGNSSAASVDDVINTTFYECNPSSEDSLLKSEKVPLRPKSNVLDSGH
jgi:hypothetical protein